MPPTNSGLEQIRSKAPRPRGWLLILAGSALVLAMIGIVNLVNREPKPIEPEGDPEVSISWLPETIVRWNGPINEMAAEYNIDPNLVAIVMTIESGGYSKAMSEVGAVGLMQVTPPTAQDIARRHLNDPRDEYDLNDPRTNIELGTAYLAYLRDEFGEVEQGPAWDTTVEIIAAGYNGGPGNAGRLYRGEGLTSEETVSYSRDVFGMWRERHAPQSPTFNRWLERGGQRLIDLAASEQP